MRAGCRSDFLANTIPHSFNRFLKMKKNIFEILVATVSTFLKPNKPATSAIMKNTMA